MSLAPVEFSCMILSETITMNIYLKIIVNKEDISLDKYKFEYIEENKILAHITNDLNVNHDYIIDVTKTPTYDEFLRTIITIQDDDLYKDAKKMNIFL